MKILAEYSTKKGTVWLLHGDEFFVVKCRVIRGYGVYRTQEWGQMFNEEALIKFEKMQAMLDNRNYIRSKCRYSSASHLCSCNSKNCPNKLGGEAYWRLFSSTCNYKVR